MNNKKVIVNTNNKEIYDKLISLNYNNEIILKKFRYGAQIGKIIKNINSNSRVLDVQNLGEHIIIRKIGPINYDVYLKY
jgi:hypothetical protein